MKISFEWLLLLILSTVVAIGIGAAFYRLCQHYRFPYLLSYFLFATVWNVFGIYGLIYVFLVPRVVPPGSYVFVYLLNYFLIVPMILALVYFFWGFVVRLVEKSIHRAFKLGFGILVFLFCAFFVINVFHILARPGSPSLDSLYLSIPILRIFKDLFIYGALVYLFLNLKRLDNPVKRKHFKVLGIVLVLGHTLTEICLMGFLPVSHPFINTVITTLVLFGLQGVVFLILKRFLRRYYTSHSLEEAVPTDFELFFARYGISKREGEIIRLMIKGHSNREIEEELFISLETVKKHIFNIYKKTGVKNRLQLHYLIRNEPPPQQFSF